MTKLYRNDKKGEAAKIRINYDSDIFAALLPYLELIYNQDRDIGINADKFLDTLDSVIDKFCEISYKNATKDAFRSGFRVFCFLAGIVSIYRIFKKSVN